MSRTRSRKEQQAIFANMRPHEIKGLKNQAQEYVVDERGAVGDYNKFEKQISDAGLPQRMVDNVKVAAKDEHRHMEDMIEIRDELGDIK